MLGSSCVHYDVLSVFFFLSLSLSLSLGGERGSSVVVLLAERRTLSRTPLIQGGCELGTNHRVSLVLAHPNMVS